MAFFKSDILSTAGKRTENIRIKHFWALKNDIIFHIIDQIKVSRVLFWILHCRLCNLHGGSLYIQAPPGLPLEENPTWEVSFTEHNIRKSHFPWSLVSNLFKFIQQSFLLPSHLKGIIWNILEFNWTAAANYTQQSLWISSGGGGTKCIILRKI